MQHSSLSRTGRNVNKHLLFLQRKKTNSLSCPSGSQVFLILFPWVEDGLDNGLTDEVDTERTEEVMGCKSKTQPVLHRKKLSSQQQ